MSQARSYESVFTGEGFGGLARGAQLAFRLPEVSATPIAWKGDIHPQAIGVSNGVVYIIGHPLSGRESRKYGNPNPPYVCFRYEDGGWIRLPLADVPRDLWSVNLWLEDEPKKDHSAVSLADKKLELQRLWLSWQIRIDPTLHL